LYINVCSSFIGESHLAVPLVPLTVRTEAKAPLLMPSQPCRSSDLILRKPAADENGSVVKNGSAETDSRSLSAAGRSMSATVLPAGDLLLGPRHCGQSADRYESLSVSFATPLSLYALILPDYYYE